MTDIALKPDLARIHADWHQLEFPTIFSASHAYARDMHKDSFDLFLDRIMALSPGMGTVLDAGCGTGTWCFPLAQVFDRVIGIDINRQRVDLARWLVNHSGVPRISIHHGSITDIDLPRDSVDFVFCYGVIVSYISLRDALNNFYRVLRPGGRFYLALNGIGWSYYLRDGKSKESRNNLTLGLRGLYNTFCRQQQDGLSETISQLLADLAHDPDLQAATGARLGLREGTVTDFLIRLGQAEALSAVVLPSGAPCDDPRQIVAVFDSLLEGRDPQAVPLAGTLAAIESDCGADYARLFAEDLLRILAGRHTLFSHSNAQYGYDPDQVRQHAEQAGFTDFRWKPIKHEASQPYSAELIKWQCLATKP